MMKLMTLTSLVIALVSCESGTPERHQKAASLESSLEAGTGDSWTVVKVDTRQQNYVVMKNETTGVFHAFNALKFTAGMSYEAFTASLSSGDHLSGLGVTKENVGSGEDSYIETVYTYGGLKFENTSALSRDLDLVASLRDEAAQAYLTMRLKSEFSLSSSRAEELAKLSTRYQRLENRRALTAAEKNVFAMSALGVSMTNVERALKLKAQGDEQAYSDMLETAAQVNRTTPEQVGRFFDELSGLL